MLADSLLRRENLDELTELFRDNVPARPDVPVERQRLVLCRDVDMAEPGVDAVAECEIDDSVRAPEVHRRFGAIFRQGIEAFSHSTGEQDDQDIVQFHWVIDKCLDARETPARAAIIARWLFDLFAIGSL